MQIPSPHIKPDKLRGVAQEKPGRLNPDEIDASDKRDYDLAKIILGFSFPAAIALLVLSHQTEPHLPSSFHLLSFAVWLAFSASLVGILLHHKFLPASKVLMNLGIVSAAIAFSLLMAILLPTYLEWLVWAFCVILSFWFFYGLYGHVCAESSSKGW